MALLELQAMKVAAADRNGGAGVNSRASLLLCGNSSLSVTTCE